MRKYIIGIGTGNNDFERVDLKDVRGLVENREENEELEFVIVANEDGHEKLFEYYQSIEYIIKKNIDVFFVYVSGCSIWKPVAMMMASYDRFDVYRAETIDSINSEYIKNIEKRRPTYREESMVHGSDVVAYSKLSIIVLGISNLVADNNTDGLKKFIEKYKNEIDGVVMAMDYMKRIVDQSNKSELERKLDDAERERESLLEEIEGLEKEKRRNSIELRDLNKDLDLTKEKLRIAEGKVLTAEAVNEAGATGVITDYPEMNTIQLNSKIGRVLYFKEISRIPYIDSFVWALFEQLKIYKVKVKLLVYDYNSELSGIYEPMKSYDSKAFINNKRHLVEKEEKFVVSEPNPAIITEIARTLPPYEVVIIYDRMYRKKDVITGNGVKKFFVCGSKKAYELACTHYGLKNVEDVIAIGNLEIQGRFLDIPRIDNYNVCTNNAKISKYMKLIGTRTGESIAKSVMEAAHITDIIKQK